MLGTYLNGATAVADYVEFIGSTTNRVVASTNVVSKPSNIVSGDLLIAVGIINSGGNISTYPSGFTQRLFSFGTPVIDIATKIATGSEPTSYNFTLSSSLQSNIALLAYRKAVDSSRLIGAVQRSSSVSSITAPSISPTLKGALLAIFCGANDFGVSSPPSGMTLRAQLSNNNPSIAVYDLIPSNPGNTGGKTLSMSPAATPSAALLMQIFQE